MKKAIIPDISPSSSSPDDQSRNSNGPGEVPKDNEFKEAKLDDTMD